jgi:hypothetical protein
MRRGPMAPAVEADLSGHEPARREAPGGRVGCASAPCLAWTMMILRFEFYLPLLPPVERGPGAARARRAGTRMLGVGVMLVVGVAIAAADAMLAGVAAGRERTTI